MNRSIQLGGPLLPNPLPIVGDVGEAIAEIGETIRTLRPRVEEALEAMPRIDRNVDTITGYVPWLIGAIGFLGAAIIINAVATYKSRDRKR